MKPGALRQSASPSSTGGSRTFFRPSGVRVTAAPSQHFSGRTFKTRNATLWSSFVVRSERHCVFFSGDTGLTTEYQDIRERLGPFDLAMLEVGAWDPAWGDMHLGPENALKAVALLDAETFLPIHWGTFRLAMHPWDQPAEVLYEQGSKDSPAARHAETRRARRTRAGFRRCGAVVAKR